MKTSLAKETAWLEQLADGSGTPGLAARKARQAKTALYEVFHENTKLGRLSTRAYSAWMINFARSRMYRQTLHQEYKVYTLMERRALPRVQPQTPLERTIVDRRSIRAFTGEPIGVNELARLLWFTYGRTDPRGVLRAVASGGGLYPLEIYVVALAVEGLDPGVYHYDVRDGDLDVISPGDHRPALREILHWQGIDIDRASFAMVCTAAFRRNTIKYLDRGYRMILMEAGEVAQNFCLLATSMGIGACLMGGFHDDRLSALLEIDGVDEAPLLAALVGRPSAAPGER